MDASGSIAEPRSATKDSRINLRITARQEHLIRRAAALTDRSLTDFVLDSAARHAEEVLADRRLFLLSNDEWSAFDRALEVPLGYVAELRDLLVQQSDIDVSNL